MFEHQSRGTRQTSLVRATTLPRAARIARQRMAGSGVEAGQLRKVSSGYSRHSVSGRPSLPEQATMTSAADVWLRSDSRQLSR